MHCLLPDTAYWQDLLSVGGSLPPLKTPCPALGPAGLELSPFGPWPQASCAMCIPVPDTAYWQDLLSITIREITYIISPA